MEDSLADFIGNDFPTRSTTTRFVTEEAIFKHEVKCLPDLIIKEVKCQQSEVLKGALSYPSVSDD